MREFADALDDRVADTVAAALLLALQQQSVGIARVLRLLADGVARDVRARREIEAARAESRQSIRMLLLIQAGVLAMLAVVPSFAAPYATPVGQTVMALLLAGTVGLLVWMRRLALGNRPPRFLGTPATESGCLGRRGHSDEPPADAAAGCGRAHRHRRRRRRGRDQPAPARAGRCVGRARRADAARARSNG